MVRHRIHDFEDLSIAFENSNQLRESETLLIPIFFCSTCFQTSGATQQQLGSSNFSCESLAKIPFEYQSVFVYAIAMPIDTPLHGNRRKGMETRQGALNTRRIINYFGNLELGISWCNNALVEMQTILKYLGVLHYF